MLRFMLGWVLGVGSIVAVAWAYFKQHPKEARLLVAKASPFPRPTARPQEFAPRVASRPTNVDVPASVVRVADYRRRKELRDGDPRIG